MKEQIPQVVIDAASDPQIQDAAKEEAQRIFDNQNLSDKFNAFLSFTKERLDAHFDTLGYVVFVFDKDNHKNKVMSTISNTDPNYYVNKLMPFILKHKKMLRKLKKGLDKKLKRIII